MEFANSWLSGGFPAFRRIRNAEAAAIQTFPRHVGNDRGEPSLHHVGHVVSSIDESIDHWRSCLNAVSVSSMVEDPIQGVRAVFIDLSPAGSTRIELIEPASPDSPVRSFADKGGGLHHLCIEVDDLDRHLARMKALKATLIRSPQPATAFGGRRIAWMFLRQKMLVEYLERAAVSEAEPLCWGAGRDARLFGSLT